MPIVTLTTDWSSGDYYIAQLKGAILQTCPNVTIVDITHYIQPFNSIQAGFILRNTYNAFPLGTIHLLGVNSEPSPRNKMVAIHVNGHFFVGINDGVFSLALDDTPDYIIELPDVDAMPGFRALPLFVYATQELSASKSITGLGKPCELKKDIRTNANYDDTGISGIVAYIDVFGNAISNITRELFEKVGRGRAFEITVQSNHNRITHISEYYDDVPMGSLIAIFNSFDLLEIAMNQVNFAKLENLDTYSSIRIKFLNDRLF
ncbi:MAG: SAM-dependent chlorinase/fluorinase [Prevotellaceae bacterium]|jgi:S-adenosylmethionine hydrolase|nr:SAM-dependent chlorinase/fluorinase [Prevotellaceae bacterium]